MFALVAALLSSPLLHALRPTSAHPLFTPNAAPAPLPPTRREAGPAGPHTLPCGAPPGRIHEYITTIAADLLSCYETRPSRLTFSERASFAGSSSFFDIFCFSFQLINSCFLPGFYRQYFIKGTGWLYCSQTNRQIHKYDREEKKKVAGETNVHTS